jgi:hypothetical protein
MGERETATTLLRNGRIAELHAKALTGGKD